MAPAKENKRMRSLPRATTATVDSWRFRHVSDVLFSGQLACLRW